MALSKDDIKRMERKGDVKGLVDALKNARASRIEVSIALNKMKDVKAVDPLIQILNDKNPEVRSSAAIILGDIGDKKEVEPLILALKIAVSNLVRGAAARALGKIGDVRAVEPLTRALSDPDRYARLVAQEVIEKFKKH